MAAKMLAAATRFRRANNAEAIPGDDEMRVFLHRGHSGSIGDFELQPGHGNHRLRGLHNCRSIRAEPLGQMHESFFEFAAENRGDSERAQILNVHGSVQAVTTEMRTWIQLAKPGNELRCEPRGGVHGQIDGDEPGIGNQRVIQGPPGKVEHGDTVAAFAKPCRGRSQAEGLPPQLVRRNENDGHALNSIAARRADSISAMIEGYAP